MVGAEVQHAVGYIAVVIAAHAGVTAKARKASCCANTPALEACIHTPRTVVGALLLVTLGLACLQQAWAADEPLPSWQDGAAKRAIIDFVARVTTPGGPAFVPASERLATFDNVGSTIKTTFEMRDGTPVLMRLPEIDFIDDKAGKPVGINKFIGRRPILAFGNSDGDHQMLQWTAAGSGPRFMGLVHHTDAEREWAYDRTSSIGRLDKALDEALAKGWTVVDMKQDWKTIFPPSSGH